jgi:hypothetical protein
LDDLNVALEGSRFVGAETLERNVSAGVGNAAT